MCSDNISKLKDELSSLEKPVCIVTHDNPDPDAISSSLGVRRIIQTLKADVQCDILYGGEISHPQNKTLMNVLAINALPKKDVFDTEPTHKDYAEKYGLIIVVDTVPERCLP